MSTKPRVLLVSEVPARLARQAHGSEGGRSPVRLVPRQATLPGIGRAQARGQPRRPGNGMLKSEIQARDGAGLTGATGVAHGGARRWCNKHRSGTQNGDPRRHSSSARRPRERVVLPCARSAISRSAHFMMPIPARTGGELQLTKRGWEGRSKLRGGVEHAKS